MSIKNIYKHFNFTGENIPIQKQVRADIYSILENLGCSKIQNIENISIYTENGYHHIGYFPFDISINHWGCFEYNLPPLKININYKYEELEEIIKKEFEKVIKINRKEDL